MVFATFVLLVLNLLFYSVEQTNTKELEERLELQRKKNRVFNRSSKDAAFKGQS